MVNVLILSLVFLSIVSVSSAYAESDEKLAFAGYLEETLGHLWAIEKNLDENNADLALVHATHPVAELYDLLKPELEEHDPELDMQLQQILLDLGKKTGSDVTREDAQKAIDQAKEVVEIARSTVVGELSSDINFKIHLIIGLLETSVVEYGEAVSGGKINEMAEFQDGSAFVWRSQQIYDTIKSEIPQHEAEEIDEFYTELWAAYDTRSDPSNVETLAGGIIHELEEVAGVESKAVELLDYVQNIRNLLTEVKEEYAEGEVDEALSLATKAYLDNFEFLEAPLAESGNEELMEEIEHMLREELRDMIKNGASSTEINAQVDKILLKMDEVAVIVPEFGPVVFIVLAASIITIVTLSLKYQKLSLIPKI
jgi:hypothetical protein